ncbi:hypothetical protein [Hypericibacter sp.]|uniref:hypothetical protein n=1 Tax=Hypericibacter sp. TaxID=2705401 RepID=UPI003D6C9049
MLPASRWFVLIAAIAVLAMIALTLIAQHLVATIPAGSPQGLRLVAFVKAAEIGLLLLFGFAMVPPAIRQAARLLAYCAHRQVDSEKRCSSRLADMVALGVWAISAIALAVTAPPLWELFSSSTGF